MPSLLFRLAISLASAGLLVPASQASVSVSTVPTGLMIQNAELRPGVVADIHVAVMGDVDEGDCQVAIHGGPYTAETWRPYAEALGPEACVLAIDHPGHGLSTVPTGIVFGDLLLDDYVTTAVIVLDALADLDIEPETILGHSLGGTVVQMLQQRLVEAAEMLSRQNVDVLAQVVDLRDEAQILSFFEAVSAKWNRLDALINNAGLGHKESLMSGKTEAWREILDVNVLALCICTREAVQRMQPSNSG
ncbi:MAG: SDR family NAD(P)-dependent oxidoreductase, partial [Myxococcota bacterium]